MSRLYKCDNCGLHFEHHGIRNKRVNLDDTSDFTVEELCPKCKDAVNNVLAKRREAESKKNQKKKEDE